MSTSDINTINDPALRDFAHFLIQKVRGVGAVCQNNRQAWISFSADQSLHKVKLFASIRFSPNHIRLHAHNIDQNGILDVDDPYPYVDIFDGSENISAIMAIIHSSYGRLVGE
jgi:hypothetical protein